MIVTKTVIVVIVIIDKTKNCSDYRYNSFIEINNIKSTVVDASDMINDIHHANTFMKPLGLC
jgi:hypothetical protein